MSCVGQKTKPYGSTIVMFLGAWVPEEAGNLLRLNERDVVVNRTDGSLKQACRNRASLLMKRLHYTLELYMNDCTPLKRSSFFKQFGLVSQQQDVLVSAIAKILQNVENPSVHIGIRHNCGCINLHCTWKRTVEGLQQFGANRQLHTFQFSSVAAPGLHAVMLPYLS